jgi:hypothetical protein
MLGRRRSHAHYSQEIVSDRRCRRICITPIGIPDGWPAAQPKRKLEEMVAYETLEGHPPLARLPYNP